MQHPTGEKENTTPGASGGVAPKGLSERPTPPEPGPSAAVQSETAIEFQQFEAWLKATPLADIKKSDVRAQPANSLSTARQLPEHRPPTP